jgi:type IV pilus assembly protein PilW
MNHYNFVCHFQRSCLRKEKNQGFSLLEILLVIILGTMLLLGLTRIYLSMNNSHCHQVSMARLQENGRAASTILAKGIHTAGYFGCASRSIQGGVEGYNSANLPDFLRNKNIAKNTDVIVIQKADSNITHLTKDASFSTQSISVESNPTSVNNLWLSISDCTASNIFQADSYVSQNIHLNRPVNHVFKKRDTEVAAFTEVAYFISESTLYSLTNGNRNPDAHKQAIVSGVKDMKIVYGVDLDGDGVVDIYYSADKVTAWNKVRSVEIVLQLEDGKEQKQWRTYVALRERR